MILCPQYSRGRANRPGGSEPCVAPKKVGLQSFLLKHRLKRHLTVFEDLKLPPPCFSAVSLDFNGVRARWEAESCRSIPHELIVDEYVGPLEISRNRNLALPFSFGLRIGAIRHLGIESAENDEQ